MAASPNLSRFSKASGSTRAIAGAASGDVSSRMSKASWRARGFREIGSDALLDNRASHAAHAGWGFAETERVVYFRKVLE